MDKKRYTNFGHRGGGVYFRNNRDRYTHVYIFLIRKKKENFFEKCMYVRPSVRAQKLCTLKLKNG